MSKLDWLRDDAAKADTVVVLYFFPDGSVKLKHLKERHICVPSETYLHKAKRAVASQAHSKSKKKSVRG